MSFASPRYLQATPLIDYNTTDIQTLITGKGWQALSGAERIGTIYTILRIKVIRNMEVNRNICVLPTSVIMFISNSNALKINESSCETSFLRQDEQAIVLLIYFQFTFPTFNIFDKSGAMMFQ